MKRSITHFFLTCGALLLALALNSFAFAQAKPAAKAPDKTTAAAPAPRNLLRIQFLRIKTGMNTEWQAFRKSESIPALRKGGIKQQTVSSQTVFGEAGYVIVTPIESLAQFDSPSPILQALGQEGASAYGARAVRFIESGHYIALETRPELSSPPAQDYQAKLFVITTTTIAPGRFDDYESFVKTALLPVIKQAAPKGYLLGRVAYGGQTNQYMSALFVDSWAELQRYREALTKAATAAKLAGKTTGIVLGTENTVYRFQPELSILPTAQ